MKIHSNKIMIPSKCGIIIEEVDNILYVQSKINYCIIKMADGKEFEFTKPLKTFEKNYPYNCFFRIHKTYLVNINHVTEIVLTNNSHVKLKTGCCLNIAVRRRSEIRKLFTIVEN